MKIRVGRKRVKDLVWYMEGCPTRKTTQRRREIGRGTDKLRSSNKEGVPGRP